MSLNLGNGLINKIYLGPDEMLKAYLGPLLVYDNSVIPQFTITNYSYEGISYAINDRDPYAVAFNNTGTKMFVLGEQNDCIFQYGLSTPFDVSTASYQKEAYIGGATYFAYGLRFSSNGQYMYILGMGDEKVHQYRLSTPFDVGRKNKASELFINFYPLDIAFNQDGTKVYILQNQYDRITQGTLSTPYIISTCTFDNVFFRISQEGNPKSFSFNNDGTRMFIVGRNNKRIYQYSLSTAYDISTTSYDNLNLYVGNEEANPYGLTFSNDGNKLFIIGNSTDKVYQYGLNI